MKICKHIFISFLIIGSSVHAARIPVKKLEIVRERERILTELTTAVYYGAPFTLKSRLLLRNIKILTENLYIHFQTCPFYKEHVKTICDNQLTEEDKQHCINKVQGDTNETRLDDLVQTLRHISEKDLQGYLMNLRCDYIIRDLSLGYFSQIRRQVQNVIFKLSGEDQIDKERRDILLFYLDEFYGPDMPHMQKEREALISHLQSCDYSSGMLDQAWNWIDNAIESVEMLDQAWDWVNNAIGNTAIRCETIIKTAQEKGITYLDTLESLKIAMSFLLVNGI